MNTFINLPGWQVRGITRNPSSSAAKALAARGVEVVQADLNDVASLITAFRNASIIFLVTDFWPAVSVPENHAKAAEQGITIRDLAFDLEVAQGVNAATAASHPTVLPALERFIFSSLADMRKWSNGAAQYKNMFESKSKIEDHVLSLPGLSEKLSTVQVGSYYTNWKQNALYRPTKVAPGKFVHRVPFTLTTQMPFVDVSADIGKFVKALVDAPAGTHLLGVSESGTFVDFLEAFGKVHNVEVKAEHVPAEEFFADVPEDLKAVLVQLTSFLHDYGWTGGDPRIKLPKDIDPDLRTVSIEEYIRGEDWSSIL